MNAKHKNDETEESEAERKRQRMPTDSKIEENLVPSKEEERKEEEDDNNNDDYDDSEWEDGECEECGAYLDPEEARDNNGMCYRCTAMERVNRIQSRLPRNYNIREVSGNHRKPCSGCGKCDWTYGDWYIFDAVQPWGTGKYCLDCAEYKNWDGSDDEGDY